MQQQENAVDVGSLIDAGTWTGYQRWLVLLVAMTIVFDGIDNQLLGIVIPTVMAEWDVPRSAFAPVVSFGYGGLMVGGLVAGFVGDRIGRRAALLIGLLHLDEVRHAQQVGLLQICVGLRPLLPGDDGRWIGRRRRHRRGDQQRQRERYRT